MPRADFIENYAFLISHRGMHYPETRPVLLSLIHHLFLRASLLISSDTQGGQCI